MSRIRNNEPFWLRVEGGDDGSLPFAGWARNALAAIGIVSLVSGVCFAWRRFR